MTSKSVEHVADIENHSAISLRSLNKKEEKSLTNMQLHRRNSWGFNGFMNWGI